MGASFGEQGRRLSYGSYLRLEELLQLQSRLTSSHDELLFIVVHQTYELWFQLILDELEATREAIDRDELFWAKHYLRRIVSIEEVMVHQVDVLDTMFPQDFLEFRMALAPASGFQSVHFREIEFLSGLKDAEYMGQVEMSSTERQRLEARLEGRTLWDAFVDLMVREGVDSLSALFLFKGKAVDLFELAEALLDHDQAFSLWRARHVLMVERQIGSKPGTGGSSGAAYLHTTLNKRFFPLLWESRSQLQT